MSNKYWIKLYHEIIYERKIAILEDRLWRRMIECFLMAGEKDERGYLPPLADMAWILRISEETLETDLNELIRVGILEYKNELYFVKNFYKRQKPMKKAEYMRRLREERQREEAIDNMPELQDSYQRVTNGNADTDTDIDKIRSEEGEAMQHYSINPVKILCDSSGLSDFPADQREWIEVIYSLVEDHGVENTTNAMRRACQQWTKTRGQNGRFYRLTNLNWINWAQEILAGGELPSTQVKKLTAAEKIELERQRILAEQE